MTRQRGLYSGPQVTPQTNNEMTPNVGAAPSAAHSLPKNFFHE